MIESYPWAGKWAGNVEGVREPSSGLGDLGPKYSDTHSKG